MKNFVLDYDYSTEGYTDVWGAIAETIKLSNLDKDDVKKVEHIPAQPFDVMIVTFGSMDAVKKFTFVYSGNDEEYTNDLMEYVRCE